MTEERIKVGDRVSVHWEYIGSLCGTVLYVPQATGDSWVIKQDNGTVSHVQMFCRMDRKLEAK